MRAAGEFETMDYIYIYDIGSILKWFIYARGSFYYKAARTFSVDSKNYREEWRRYANFLNPEWKQSRWNYIYETLWLRFTSEIYVLKDSYPKKEVSKEMRIVI